MAKEKVALIVSALLLVAFLLGITIGMGFRVDRLVIGVSSGRDLAVQGRRTLGLVAEQRLPETNATAEEERCRSYGFGYDQNRRVRRIFAGSPIAEDEWAALGAVAAEVHDMYHVYAFVESNRTHSMYPRALRFAPGSGNWKRLQGLYGPQTDVTMDIFHPVEEVKEKPALLEQDQRELILERWKASGMRPDDIGLLSDADETFTRDFLLAAQTCDVPEFRPGQDCLRPKIVGAAVAFESSPDCITRNRLWHHPDMAIAECVYLIGDEAVHKPGKRDHPSNPRHGPRSKGYGTGGYGVGQYSEMPNTAMYPLLNAYDYRLYDGGRQVKMLRKAARPPADGQPTGYNAYHFHNFFGSIAAIRHKYKTYSEPRREALTRELGALDVSLNVTVNCALNRSDEGVHQRRVAGGLQAIVGPKPVYFTDEYRAKRGEELRAMFEQDQSRK